MGVLYSYLEPEDAILAYSIDTGDPDAAPWDHFLSHEELLRERVDYANKGKYPPSPVQGAKTKGNVATAQRDKILNQVPYDAPPPPPPPPTTSPSPFQTDHVNDRWDFAIGYLEHLSNTLSSSHDRLYTGLAAAFGRHFDKTYPVPRGRDRWMYRLGGLHNVERISKSENKRVIAWGLLKFAHGFVDAEHGVFDEGWLKEHERLVEASRIMGADLRGGNGEEEDEVGIGTSAGTVHKRRLTGKKDPFKGVYRLGFEAGSQYLRPKLKEKKDNRKNKGARDTDVEKTPGAIPWGTTTHIEGPSKQERKQEKRNERQKHDDDKKPKDRVEKRKEPLCSHSSVQRHHRPTSTVGRQNTWTEVSRTTRPAISNISGGGRGEQSDLSLSYRRGSTLPSAPSSNPALVPRSAASKVQVKTTPHNIGHGSHYKEASNPYRPSTPAPKSSQRSPPARSMPLPLGLPLGPALPPSPRQLLPKVLPSRTKPEMKPHVKSPVKPRPARRVKLESSVHVQWSNWKECRGDNGKAWIEEVWDNEGKTQRWRNEMGNRLG